MSSIELIALILSVPGAIASTLAILQAIKKHNYTGKREPEAR
jgi:hypothetical protein